MNLLRMAGMSDEVMKDIEDEVKHARRHPLPWFLALVLAIAVVDFTARRWIQMEAAITASQSRDAAIIEASRERDDELSGAIQQTSADVRELTARLSVLLEDDACLKGAVCDPEFEEYRDGVERRLQNLEEQD